MNIQKKIEERSGKILSFFLTIQKKRVSATTRLFKGETRLIKFIDRKILGEELLTVPNMFSLSRILFGLILLPMIIFNLPNWIIITIFSLAILTDWLDGAWARLEGGNTILGAILDPWCDKFLFICCATALYPFIDHRLFWIAVGTEITLSSFSLFTIIGIKKNKIATKVDFRSNFYGKVKFCLEGIALFAFLLQQTAFGNVFLTVAIVFAVGSAIGKIRRLNTGA